MLIYAVDLGTTNLKVVLYDQELCRLGSASSPAVYFRDDTKVEFEPTELFTKLIGLMHECAKKVLHANNEHAIIAITGQAESIVLVDKKGAPVRMGMSWLDNRAEAEALEMTYSFDTSEAFSTTGQPFPTSTWPAAKIRWLAAHEPESLKSTKWLLMIKDYVIYRFSGLRTGEVTTRGFTYFYNVNQRTYWDEMLDYIHISSECLPEIVSSGMNLGKVLPELNSILPPALSYQINSGALDHFAAMVGTDSYLTGVVSESAGSVLSLSELVTDWTFDSKRKVSFHNGLRDNEVILFNCADSGGIVFDWFRREGLGGMNFEAVEEALTHRLHRNAPIFLPYLTGVNPPEYSLRARGAFLDLELSHDRFDMAYAVQEGTSHLLRRNLEYMWSTPIKKIVSTGGGTASSFWNQLKADICGVDVVVPDEKEATCRGAAVLALVASNHLKGISEAKDLHQPPTRVFQASKDSQRELRYKLFESYLEKIYGGE
jgi:sugar (pentulose or hexulose) kinase